MLQKNVLLLIFILYCFAGAIKGLARETVHKSGGTGGSNSISVCSSNSNSHNATCNSGEDKISVISKTGENAVLPYNLRRVRLLIELVEQLEKTMYNAADGTATALISPPKVR